MLSLRWAREASALTYAVYYGRSSASMRSVVVEEPRATLRSLLPLATYEVFVVAMNRGGYSERSASLYVHMTSPPRRTRRNTMI